MSTHEQFLRSIIARPKDDAPRLLYADWLEERGDLRGEFIRLQCRLARMDEDDDNQFPALKQREQALLEQYGAVWGRSMRKLVGNIVFHRGFPEYVSLQTERFFKNAVKIFEEFPVRHVKLRGAKPLIEKLARCEHLEKLDSLSLNFNHLGMGRIKKFIHSPHLKNLAGLDLGNNSIGYKGLHEVLQAKNLSAVASLGLDGNRLGDRGAAALAKWPHLRNLRRLDLNGNEIGDEGLIAFAESPYLPPQIEVHLGGKNVFGDQGLAAIARTPLVSGWRSIDFNDHYHAVTHRGLKALLQSPYAKCLRTITLQLRNLGVEGAAALAQGKRMAHVHYLDLSFCCIGAEGVAALAASRRLKQLRQLQLRGEEGEPQIGKVLAESQAFPRLKHLEIIHLGAEGVKALARSPLLKQLESLDLSYGACGDEGAIALAKSPYVQNLHRLDLHSNKIRDKGALALLESENLKDLQFLHISYNNIRSKTARRIEERFPETTSSSENL